VAEEFPGLDAAPPLLRSVLDVISTKLPALPRSTHPTSVIGDPVVVCVPGREVVSAREPDVVAPGCDASFDPGCCVPLWTGD
jgi:hypothetical protein